MKKITSFTLLFTLILSFTLSLVSCNPESEETYRRDTTTNDVLLDSTSDSMFFSFIVRPQVDADDLRVAIGFYDKSGYPVGYGYKKLGKVKAGQEYHVEFDDSYFSYKQIMAISKYRLLNVEGKVTVEQSTQGICTSHDYDDGHESKRATCDCVGERIHSCINCGYKKVERLPRTEHAWVDNKYGDTSYICTNCCIQSDSKN